MGKGILKRQESLETTISTTPDSSCKHVKWDEEKLKESEAIKMTIPKGQIDEPKTPFQQGQYGTSCDEEESVAFKLRGEESETSEDRRSSISQSENEFASSFSSHSSAWESSMSEFEMDEEAEEAEDEAEREKHEKFKSMRAQHYFMKQSLERGKHLIESESESEE